MFGGGAATLDHDGLPMPADIGQEFDTAGISYQQLRVVTPRQYLIVAGLGHHQFMAYVSGPARKQ